MKTYGAAIFVTDKDSPLRKDFEIAQTAVRNDTEALENLNLGEMEPGQHKELIRIAMGKAYPDEEQKQRNATKAIKYAQLDRFDNEDQKPFVLQVIETAIKIDPESFEFAPEAIRRNPPQEWLTTYPGIEEYTLDDQPNVRGKDAFTYSTQGSP